MIGGVFQRRHCNTYLVLMSETELHGSNVCPGFLKALFQWVKTKREKTEAGN